MFLFTAESVEVAEKIVFIVNLTDSG